MNKIKYKLTNLLTSKTLICFLFIIAFLERIIMAIIRSGYNHPHEIYRVLEPARKFIFGSSVSIYEFDLKMLSYIPVLFHTIIIKALILSGVENPLYQTKILRLFYASLSMITVYGLYFCLKKFTNKKWAASGLLYVVLWFPFSYWQIHLFENILVSNILFLLIIFYLVQENKLSFALNLFAGTLLGLMFFIRFQSAFIPILFLIITVLDRRYKAIIPAISGFIVALIAFGYIDSLYGIPFLEAPFKNFDFNIMHSGATRNFGAQSPIYYFTHMFKFYSPLIFIILIPAIYSGSFVAKRISFLALGYLLIHTIIAHKEFRFIFPILPILPVIGIAGLYHEREKIEQIINKNKIVPVILAASLIFSLIWGAYRGFFRYSYSSYGENCNRLWKIGKWYNRSQYRHINYLHIDADPTFMCGSFHLGKTDGIDGPLRVSYGREIPTVQKFFILKKERSSTKNENFITTFSGWNLFLKE